MPIRSTIQQRNNRQKHTLLLFIPTTLSTVLSGDQKASLQLWTASIFLSSHQKEISSPNFEHAYSFSHPSLPPFLPSSLPPQPFGNCTLSHRSKAQLKGERHKEMTPMRKCLVLGRALAGRKSIALNTSIRVNGTMGGRAGSKDFFWKMMHLFYPGRQTAKTRREREKSTLLNIFWKKALSLVRLSCVVKVCFIQLCGSVCICLSGLFLVEAQKDYSWHVQGHSVDTDALQEAELWIQHE